MSGAGEKRVGRIMRDENISGRVPARIPQTEAICPHKEAFINQLLSDSNPAVLEPITDAIAGGEAAERASIPDMKSPARTASAATDSSSRVPFYCGQCGRKQHAACPAEYESRLAASRYGKLFCCKPCSTKHHHENKDSGVAKLVDARGCQPRAWEGDSSSSPGRGGPSPSPGAKSK